MNETRRDFLIRSTSAVAISAASYSRVFGANERTVRVLQIGCGGQGRNHLNSYKTLADVEIVGLCDPDRNQLTEAANIAGTAKHYSDVRLALEQSGAEAVSIATPDHWHVPAALLSLQAGKHVYVEKPCSHNLREGRLLADAAQRTGLKVQHGTQSRSSRFIIETMNHLREGVIGEVLLAKAWNVQRRGNIGHASPSEPPAHVDYELWVGPAPFLPFQSNRFHYNWHWWYNFGTGDAGNDGVHEIDYALWGLGVESHPSKVVALGGKRYHDDDQQFPDTMTAVMDFPKSTNSGRIKQLIFEMRLWSTNAPYNIDNGVEYHGTKGRVLITKRGKVQFFGERDKPLDIAPAEVSGVSVATHQLNFLNAVRDNEPLNAPADIAHRSAAICHLANAAVRAGHSIDFDPEKELAVHPEGTRPPDESVNQILRRDYRENHWAVPAGA